MRPVRVAAIQARPRSRTFEEMMAGGDVEHAIELLDQATAPGVDIVCFPELCPMRGEDEMREKAREAGVYLICGLREDVPGAAYNTATLIGPDGKLIGRQRKVFPTAIELSRGIVPGHGYQAFQTEVGRIGMIVCADLPFSRQGIVELKRRGAEIVFNPSWWFALGAAYPATIIGRHLEYGIPIFGVDMAKCSLGEHTAGGFRKMFPEAGGYTTAAVPPPCGTLDELAAWFRTEPGGANSAAGFATSLGEDEGVLHVTLDLEAVRNFPGYYFSENAPRLARRELDLLGPEDESLET